ncbi:APC family permease [Hamadaea tsunoensis]|uniref:APC family permease n=1 Tax=Hamadaea tsunoensis TaxID=53368 RepID=UPI000A00464B|nr:APC family permease [Hamadaea tsunoensis]
MLDLKRVVVGRPLRSDRLTEQLLPKRIALPIFASDPLSSVAYATQEILLVLTLGGMAYLYLAPWVGLGVIVLLGVVVLSYRQVVRAYPSGGGSYEVASENLGRSAGLVVAAALMVDYIMTVAVSVAAGVDNIISALPQLNPYRVLVNLVFVALLAALNLRGVRESGRIFAVPTYLFVVGILAMIGTGLVQVAIGRPPVAESAGWHIIPAPGHVGLTGLALLLLALRAFSSGCTALTGAEAISNGVPAFRKPKGENAARTMAAMGILSIVMFAGITALALIAKVHYVENACDLVGFTGNCTTDAQRTVIAQLAAAVFGGTGSPFFFYIQTATALILILAANTAFNGFPLLGSILAEHRYLPRQLHTRGDRLAFSNGILLLALIAGALIYAYAGSVTSLIQLYILGVFTSFTLSQTGMVRHWNKLLRVERDPAARRRMHHSRLINAFGACFTGLVLVIVTVTKFTHGAYLVVIAIPILYAMMRGIRRHYDRVAAELAPAPGGMVLPSRIRAVVLVSRLHRPTIQALAYARATRPDSLTALTVAITPEEVRHLQQEWDEHDIPVPLTVIDSPYRDITGSVLGWIAELHRERPRDLIVVFIPEYVVDRWWEHLLHNQSALRLKARLLFQRGVMVTSVPWQLESAEPAAAPAGSPGTPPDAPAPAAEPRPDVPAIAGATR